MSAEEIQREIEQTRERLGETVDELAAKADVKARARATAAEAKTRARKTAAEAGTRARKTTAEVSGRVRRSQVVQRRWPLAVTAGVLVAGSVAIWRRRKR
ncbi:MAG: DUF3618 domain-containing protein [Streptosporangiaceae bacterium]